MLLQVDKLGPIIGQGAFSTVYLSSSGDFLIKVLDNRASTFKGFRSAERRFHKEYKFGQLSIPNTINTYSFGKCGNHLCYCLDYYDLGPLKREMVLKDGPDKYFIQVLNALYGLHSIGIIHRDIKEDNVFCNSKGEVAIGDLGTAIQMSVLHKTLYSLVKPKYGVGTFPYMPPEQIIPERGISNGCPQNDIYSFGVMAYKMITGQYPFGEIKDDDEILEHYKMNVLNSNWNRSLLAKANVSIKWKTVIERCLALNWKERPYSVCQLLSLL